MSKVNEVLEEVRQSLQSIAGFNQNALHVLTEKDFLAKIAQAPKPLVGIMYEGLRSRSESDKPSHRVGLMADLNIAVVLVMNTTDQMGGDLRGTAIEYLDKIRAKLRDTSSVAGHSWRFILEAPALEKDGYTLWIQRWTTPVPLTK